MTKSGQISSSHIITTSGQNNVKTVYTPKHSLQRGGGGGIISRKGLDVNSGIIFLISHHK